MCSRKCEDSELHALECRILRSGGVKVHYNRIKNVKNGKQQNVKKILIREIIFRGIIQGGNTNRHSLSISPYDARCAPVS